MVARTRGAISGLALLFALAGWSSGSSHQGLTSSLPQAYGEFSTNPARENKLLTLKTGVNTIAGIRREVQGADSQLTPSERTYFLARAIRPLTGALAAAHRLVTTFRSRNARQFQSARWGLAAAEDQYLQYGRSLHAFGCASNPVVPLTRHELCQRAHQQGVTAPYCRP